MTGPFEPVLRGDALPTEFREQFLLEGGGVVLEGALDEVWHRPRAIGPLLALLARWNVLFADTGCGIPAELEIGRDPSGGHSWRRRFDFARVRRFDAVLAWDERRRRVVERTGPFELAWDVRFVPPRRIEIRTIAAALLVFGRRVPLPRALVPDVRAVESVCGRGRIHVDLALRQPFLGDVFGYAGTFGIRRA